MNTNILRNEILRTLTAEERTYPLIESVLSGEWDVDMYVESVDDQICAMIIREDGWSYTVGNSQTSAFHDQALDYTLQWIREKKRPIYWFGIPHACRKMLDSIESVKIHDAPRYTFEFDHEAYRQIEPFNCDYVIECIGKHNINRFVHYCEVFGQFWSSENAFLNDGFGFVAMNGDEVIGHAFSASVDGGCAELDIQTNPDYRGLGISKALIHAFIDECLNRELKPKWDCRKGNDASVALANRFGFRIVREYPFTFVVPNN